MNITKEDTLKYSKKMTCLQKITQQGLRGLVLLLLFLGVSCSDSSSSGGAGNPDITGTLIDNVEFNYAEVEYGTINLREGFSNAIYTISNVIVVEATNAAPANVVNAISVASDGKITIAAGLGVRDYTFQVVVTDTSDPENFYPTSVQRFRVDPQTITAGDFTLPASSVTNEYGFTDTSYGTVTLTGGVTADFAITNSQAPDEEISIAANGEITIASGLEPKRYSLYFYFSSAS